jgi:hypothetical protein
MTCALQNKPFLVSRLRKEVVISILNRHIFRSVFPCGCPGFIHTGINFRRQTDFDCPGSIVALFLSGKKIHFPNRPVAKSNFGLQEVFWPGPLPHRQSLEAQNHFGSLSTSQADCDLAQLWVGYEEEKEGRKSGEEQRMDPGLVDLDHDELGNSSTSDCPEANDAHVIQRLLKINPTGSCKGSKPVWHNYLYRFGARGAC